MLLWKTWAKLKIIKQIVFNSYYVIAKIFIPRVI